MPNTKHLLAALGLATAATSALAWDDFGHMVVAAIAYGQLKGSPAIRPKVDALIELNPDYPTWIAGVPAAQRGEVAFLMASRWPDAIKRKSTYVNDGADNGETPVEPVASLNIGYQDKARHKYWHYKDVGFSTDGTPVEPAKVPNVETQIVRFRATLASPKAGPGLKSYDLSWLVHLVGDVHQPLHATSRFTADLPHGDVGGNKVALCTPLPCRAELHAFWDDAIGTDEGTAPAIARAAAIAPAPAADARITKGSTWIQESVDAAKADVYVAPIGAAGQGPYAVDDAYRARARDVATQRIALAGARLASLIRTALK
jgi:hypothetical protein